MPCSLVGVGLALPMIAFGAKARLVRGTLEFTFRHSGRVARWLPFRAITFGHVILAVTAEELERMRRHERVHVAQYERWGLLFFPLYAGSSLCQLARGRRAYWDNHFEIQARRLSGETRAA